MHLMHTSHRPTMAAKLSRGCRMAGRHGMTVSTTFSRALVLCSGTVLPSSSRRASLLTFLSASAPFRRVWPCGESQSVPFPCSTSGSSCRIHSLEKPRRSARLARRRKQPTGSSSTRARPHCDGDRSVQTTDAAVLTLARAVCPLSPAVARREGCRGRSRPFRVPCPQGYDSSVRSEDANLRRHPPRRAWRDSCVAIAVAVSESGEPTSAPDGRENFL